MTAFCSRDAPPMRAPYRSWGAALVFVTGLAGCAMGSGSTVVVQIDPAQLLSPQPETAHRAKVEVVDIRKEINTERSTILNVSMGQVSFKPPETELVKSVIEAKADAVLAKGGVTGAPPVVYCGIRAFDVSTPATALYWDVTTRIELLLRVGDKEKTVSGTASERTYVWPSAEIIKNATINALRQTGADAEKALGELFAADNR